MPKKGNEKEKKQGGNARTGKEDKKNPKKYSSAILRQIPNRKT
jgi:hypothetical protein